MGRKIRIEMGGLRYGRLVGIEFSHSVGGHAHWRFACDCGNETVAGGTAVRSGTTASCGCLHREISAARLLKHGHRAAKRHEPTYRAWQEINTICSNPGSARYRDFGARGIRVCPAWKTDFETFLADMGERPPLHVLVRLDLARDFEAANCRWTTVRDRSQRAIECANRRRKRRAVDAAPLAPPSPEVMI
ncbi:hypothetical protein [Sphingomonas bacterium]|uniref:hypothetical protein n=1 Tax=Sphingomonas bacterium TaxID=1895847 RepID=UPI001576979F|nr:hypothetical protein [Sphingomonas bacterium]